jgi:2-keto-3-deoxy-L-rhamnonate aldolase RhmA
MVITVIEEASAVECIDEIAATPGIDVLFIGTSDLSFSLGLRGRQNEPKLQAAIDRIVDAARRHNKFLGRPAGSPEQVVDFRKQGFQMFQCTTELGLIAAGARQLLEPLGIRGLPDEQRCLY